MIGKNNVLVLWGLRKLVVRNDGETRLVAGQGTFGFVRRRGCQTGAYVFKRKPARSQLRWVYLNTNGGFLLPAEGNLSHARKLCDLLREKNVGVFVDDRNRQRGGARG